MNLSRARLFWSMTLFEAKRFREFPLEAMATVAARIIDTTLLIVFWTIVAQHSSVGNINVRQIVSYYLILGGLIPFFYQHFGIGAQMIKTIKGGELSQILIRPISPLIYPWTWRTGRNFINLVIGMIQAIIGIIVLGSFSNLASWLLLPVLANALLINAAFNISIGAMAFYMVEARGLKNAFLHVARLCRGEFIPIYLMPAGVAAALQFSPFPASQYHLIALIQGKEPVELWAVLVGLAWSALLMFLAIRLWRHGLKKYEAVGI